MKNKKKTYKPLPSPKVGKIIHAPEGKGFGFIALPTEHTWYYSSDAPSIFVHVNNVKSGKLEEGNYVAYNEKEYVDKNGVTRTKAINVYISEEAPKDRYGYAMKYNDKGYFDAGYDKIESEINLAVAEFEDRTDNIEFKLEHLDALNTVSKDNLLNCKKKSEQNAIIDAFYKSVEVYSLEELTDELKELAVIIFRNVTSKAWATEADIKCNLDRIFNSRGTVNKTAVKKNLNSILLDCYDPEKKEQVFAILKSLGFDDALINTLISQGVYYATKESAERDLATLIKKAEVEAQRGLIKQHAQSLGVKAEELINKSVNDYIRRVEFEKLTEEEIKDLVVTEFGLDRNWTIHPRRAHFAAAPGKAGTGDKSVFKKATSVIKWSKA